MCASSVKRPVKACAKGGHGNQPPPSIPPEPAFHPAICAWGWFVFSIYLSKTSKSQPLNISHAWMIEAVFQQQSVPHSNCYKHSHLGTTTATADFIFFTEELYWSYWRWRWQWEISKVFELENIWNGPRWFHPHKNTTILHFSRDWRNLTISSL